MSQQFPLWGAQSRPKPRLIKPRSLRTKVKRVDRKVDLTLGDTLARAIGHAKRLQRQERERGMDFEEAGLLQQRLEKETEEMVEEWRQHHQPVKVEDANTLMEQLRSHFGSKVPFTHSEIRLALKPFQEKSKAALFPKKNLSVFALNSYAPETPSIFTIPGKIRFKVYQYLDMRDRVSCQMVCRQMRNEVRRYAGIVANITENTTWGTSFMRDIICETIRVQRFQQPKLSPSQLVYKRMFVKHLCFVGSVPHQFVDAFAARCPNVQRLSVHSQITEKMLFLKHPILRKQLDGWRMKETISRFPRRLCHVWQLFIGPPATNALLTVPLMLKMFRYPHLKRLVVKLDDYLPVSEAKEIHLAIFDAIQSRMYHLKELIIKTMTIPGESRFRGHLYLHRPTDLIIKVSQHRQLSRFTFTEPILDYQLWSLFLCEQKKLKILQFLQLIQFPVYLHVIPRNRTTLVTVGIQVCLWYRKHVPMKLDLTVFNLCVNLKELFIHIKSPFIPGESDIFNFKRLPRSLEVLGVHNCMCIAKDMITVSKLPNLRSLGLVMVKKPDLLDYCLNCHALRKLLRTRTLDELYLSGFCLSKYGAVNAHRLGALCSALTRGYTNMFYMRPPTDEERRWVEVTPEKKFAFKLVDSWGFDLAHSAPPQSSD